MFHSNRSLPTSLVRAAAATLLAGATFAQGQVVDLSNWQQIQYEFNFQPDASWDLQTGNTAVLQSVNSDGSIFLSDFDAAGQEIRGTWRVDTGGDDDFMGFVFGYQGRGQYYLFDWKKGSQNFAGFAEAGMSLKIVDVPGGADPVDTDLWPTAGSANVSVPLHNTIPWVSFTDYEFVLNWVPGTIEITVLQGSTVLENWTLNDSTYTDGAFGFYNYSQDNVLYQGFTQQGVPEIYCTAKLNSQGCTPVIAYTGFGSLSDPNPFDISASMLINNQFGLLFYSLDGPAATPFQGGTLCLQPAMRYTPVRTTGGSQGGRDCSGTLSFDFNAFLQGGGAPTVIAGDRINAQFFYRDPANADGTGYGLTDAVEFFVLP